MPERRTIGYVLGATARPHPLCKGDVLTMGREQQNSIAVEDVLTSRQHAALVCTEESEVFIKDLGSHNGTWLNDEYIQPRRRMRVHSGDAIRIGGTVLFFVGHEPDVEPHRFRANATRRLAKMDTVSVDLGGKDAGKATAEPEDGAEAKEDVKATKLGLPPVLDRTEPSLSGNLRDESLAQVLQFINSTGMTGELRVHGKTLSGLIALRKGVVFFADAGKYKRVHAIFALARQRVGRFAFKKMKEAPERPPNVKEPMMKVIFECCRRLDEAELAGMD